MSKEKSKSRHLVEEVRKASIESNHQHIKSSKPKVALQSNPKLLNEEIERVQEKTEVFINVLESYLEELKPFVQNLSANVIDITKETHFCAVYLLMCQAMQEWEALLILAKNGYGTDMTIFIRVIKESTSMAELFADEFRRLEDKKVKKWFSGDIVTQSEYRKAMKKLFDDDVQIDESLNNLHRTESGVIHASYTSTLERVSPFTEDFDFTNHTRSLRVLYNFGYVLGTMAGTINALKFIYIFLLRDQHNYDQLNTIYNRYQEVYKEVYIP